MYHLSEIMKVMDTKDYMVFKNQQGYDLNIVGVRTSDMTANTFNDWLNIFYINKGIWSHFAFPATTDPGTYYRENPMNVDGTAIIKPGQYRGVYKIGIHQGYKALEQKGPITVYRDANRDNVLDTMGMEEMTDNFYTNIHRASEHQTSRVVNRWSAGCQVVADPIHFSFFMALCKKAAEIFGDSFSYTLLLQEWFHGTNSCRSQRII